MSNTYPRPFFDGPLRPEALLSEVEGPVEGLHPSCIQTIQVTKDISLKYDADDRWFGLQDIWAGAYDELGAVLMTFDDLDALIVALGQLREKVK